VERAIRPIALGRKNHLFAGSDGGEARWAVVASLLATAKLNEVEPFTYLKDVLERLSNGYPMARLDDFLPWNWTSKKLPPQADPRVRNGRLRIAQGSRCAHSPPTWRSTMPWTRLLMSRLKMAIASPRAGRAPA
jgi:hypothetical protein